LRVSFAFLATLLRFFAAASALRFRVALAFFAAALRFSLAMLACQRPGASFKLRPFLQRHSDLWRSS
jgi:hypothetical protein